MEQRISISVVSDHPEVADIILAAARRIVQDLAHQDPRAVVVVEDPLATPVVTVVE